MNEEVKQLWVSALRSGEYKQGTVRLKTVNPDGPTLHCCLGVLCELHDKQYGCEQSFDNISGSLPEHVRIWADLDESIPRISRPADSYYSAGYTTSISFLNDVEGYNFSRLANLIEAQL